LKFRYFVVAAALILVAVGLGWWLTHRTKPAAELVLFGNVDLRQVELAFNGTDRIAAVLAVEGDRVKTGQILARLDSGRLLAAAAQAQAQIDAQQQALSKLQHGSRPEEVTQAKGNFAAAAADAADARVKLGRLNVLAVASGGRALSRQDLDDARSAAQGADARLLVSQQALRLVRIGPRREDIDQARAQLKSNRAQLALLRIELGDAQLVAPLNATVRSSLMEPGEMASPQRPVFALAITDPKWVRAYVSDLQLGEVHPGMAATVTADGFAGRTFPGWVGFISSVAEFTPKSVQTTELRTSLVYEIRVFVKDPGDALRLGMPATVHLPLAASHSAR
jgi:HlyD family secretion protein